jgi:hypothetical protein
VRKHEISWASTQNFRPSLVIQRSWHVQALMHGMSLLRAECVLRSCVMHLGDTSCTALRTPSKVLPVVWKRYCVVLSRNSLNLKMFSSRFHRMWNHKVDLLIFVSCFDIPNSRNSATTATCRIDDGFSSICVILASFGKNTLWLLRSGP